MTKKMEKSENGGVSRDTVSTIMEASMLLIYLGLVVVLLLTI